MILVDVKIARKMTEEIDATTVASVFPSYV